MRILVTRPAEDAATLAEQLRKLGIEPVIAPLFTVQQNADAEVDISGIQAIHFTSANGVRAFARAIKDRAQPVFSVGAATAEAARKAGFTRIESAGGNVDDLARLIIARLDPGDGPVFQASGSNVAGDLKGALEGAGFTLRREVLYRAEVASQLPPEAAQAMSVRTLDGVLLFSPRTGAAFVRLALAAGHEAALAGMYAYCLSQAVGNEITDVRWRDVRVARKPELQCLLDLLGED